MIKNCVYFCEGPCEEALIKALQKEPALVAAGRPRPFNVIQNIIPNSILLQIKQGTTVVFVFDTDKEITDKLQKSIELVKKHCPQSKIVFLIQVKNLEDELVRCTDVKKVTDLTQSQSVSNFKTAFCRIKELRELLERHQIDVGKLWTTNPPDVFAFVPQNSELIKLQVKN